MTKGWAVAERGEILIATVSPGRIGAIVNWLVASQRLMVLNGTSEAAIEQAFADRASAVEAEAIEVTISRSDALMSKPTLPEKIAALRAGLKGLPPGPWEVEGEKQEDATHRHNEFAMFDDRGYRLCGTENSDWRFGVIHQDGPDEDGFCSHWNEDARVLMEHLARCDAGTIGGILDTLAAQAAEIELIRTALQTTAGNIKSLGPAGALGGSIQYREWLAVVEKALGGADV